MGCDIHSVAQVKKNGKWKTVLQDVAGDDRSYNTFGVLANVRNGYGFAGCDTGDGFQPISEPRGLPADFITGAKDEEGHYSEEFHPISVGTETGDDYSWAEEKYKEQRLAELSKSTYVWMGDHSHSFLGLDELENYFELKAKAVTNKRGYIAEDEYKKIRGTNESPSSWSGGISGRNIVTYTAKEYENLNGKIPEGKEIYVQYSWQVTYLEATNIKKIIEELRALATKYEVSSKDVRFVFGFDS